MAIGYHLLVDRALRFPLRHHSDGLLLSLRAYYPLLRESYHPGCCESLGEGRGEAIKIHGSLPETITLVTHNDPQMTSKGFLEYPRNSGHFKHARISYRRPTSIGLIERFHSTLKEEEVWVKGYRDPIEARRSITRFIKEYSYQRPHQRLGTLPHGRYIAQGPGGRRATTGGEKTDISGPNSFSF